MLEARILLILQKNDVFHLRNDSNGDVTSKDKRLWEEGEEDDDDEHRSDFNSKRTRIDLSTGSGTGR